jgi:hypothetical protein
MKTKVLIVILMLISTVTIAQNIKLSGSLKLGYNSQRTIIYPPQEIKDLGYLPFYDQAAMYGRLRLNGNYKGFNLYTSNRVFFKKDGWDSFDFNPIQTELITGLSYTIKNITLNYEHFCSHSISGKNFSHSYDDIGIEITF